MFNGPGKYNYQCTRVREMTGGGVILIVVDGKRGEGFEVQATLEQILKLPAMLRTVADGIDQQIKAQKQREGEL